MSKSEHNERSEEEITSDLLALLYSDESEVADDGQQVDGQDTGLSDELQSELDDFKGIRSLFAQMDEEEPSHAGMQQLLAIAAKEAPKPAEEKRGFFAWFSDLFGPIAHHPGLAAAASLMLVAGVAGTLYVTGGDQIAQPEVSSKHEAPADTTTVAPGGAPEFDDLAPTTTATVDQPTEVLAEEAATEEEAEPEDLRFKCAKIDPAEGARDLERKREAKKGNKERRNLESSLKGSTGGEGGAIADGILGGGGVGNASSFDSNSSGRRGSGSSSTRGPTTGGKAGLGTKAKDEKPAEPANEPAPPPPAAKPKPEPRQQKQQPAPKKPAQSPGDFGESFDDDSGAEGEAADEVGPNVQSLHAQALKAVKGGKCSLYDKLARQIRNADSAYYDRTFLSDKRLAPCRTAKKK